VDLGVLERADRVWVSDCIDPLERQHMMRWTAQLVPPEYLGSHIASGRSHTTGRMHDLSFRAATAVFGHLGIEWDLAKATAEELRDLGAWVSFFKEHRALLLGGQIVRMDGFDDNVLLHGVVADDRSEALLAMAVVGSASASPGPRLRFRDLERGASYRVRPLVVGTPPAGLEPARWWGDAPEFPGSVLTGAVLADVGVAAPIVFPDQVVLLHAARV
jgi:alpha-galactosidase